MIIHVTKVSDDAISDLSIVLPDTLVISALDLIDRGNVITYVTPWGKVDYEVLGTTATYHVQLDLPSHVPFHCACPAFAYAVLMTETHIMCKHILATLLARKLKACMERPVTADELAEIFAERFSSSSKY